LDVQKEVEDYVRTVPGERRERFLRILQTIERNVPQAEPSNL